MAGLNKATLIGHLGRNPEIRYSQQGSAVVNFSVATSEQWTDRNGDRQERTEWHRIVVFGKAGEICEKYLQKGSQVYLEGRLQTRNYEKDGQTHYITEIVVASFLFLGGNRQNAGGHGQPQGNPSQGQGNVPDQVQNTFGGNSQVIDDDDVPF